MSPQKPNEKNSIWGRLFSIPHDDPMLTENTWQQVQPCKHYSLGSSRLLITQPSSSFWVYLLGVLTTFVGIAFIVTMADQTSRLLWGIGLVLWGIGALVAGTSYQAFGYQLKCQHRPIVAWTNWWEVVYLLMQQFSVNALLAAVAYSSLHGEMRQWAINAAVITSLVYLVIIAIGAFKPVKSLITFELMVHFCTPAILFMLGLSSWNYLQAANVLDATLITTWVGLIATMAAYHWYFRAGIGQKLWSKGRWFSENDVLHVLLILWIAYIALVLFPQISDLK